MKNYTADILVDNKLYIPILHSTKKIDFSNIKKINSDLFVEVDKEFCDIWLNGPKNKEAVSALAEALVILTKSFNKLIRIAQNSLKVQTKENAYDFVTHIDTGIEMLIRIWINYYFPKHKIIGEEGYKDEIKKDDFVWYLDPIDGTSNYIRKNKNITCHIGCIKSGKPYFSLVGLPFMDEIYFGHYQAACIFNSQNKAMFTSKSHASKTNKLIIGTEFKINNEVESRHYQKILQALKAKEFRVKSIGINLIELLKGNVSAFYKEAVKYWDIVAPLALISFIGQDIFDVEMYIPNKTSSSRLDYFACSPYANDSVFLERLNSQHKKDCRIGLLLVTPKNKVEIKNTILRNTLFNAA
jgi:myo-inositol-1(or 4)-monophosphatase